MAGKKYHCVAFVHRGKVSGYLSCTLKPQRAAGHLAALKDRGMKDIEIVKRGSKPRGVKAPPRGTPRPQGSLFSKRGPERQTSLFGEGTRKERRKEIEDGLAKLKADYAKAKTEGAYSTKGEREVRMALANIERLLKSNKLKGAYNWLGVAREEMIKAYKLGLGRAGLGYKSPEDFEDDYEAWEDYQNRYWGRMKKCALSTVIGVPRPWVDQHSGQRSGTREICLSASQVRKLFSSTEPPRLLGCGAFACAWEKGKRRVVKITTDSDDVEATKVGQGLAHVVKLYGAYSLPGAAKDAEGDEDRAYAMVVERLHEMPEEMREWVESIPLTQFVASFEDHYGTRVNPGDGDSSFSFSPAQKRAYIQDTCSSDYDEDREGSCERFASQVVDTVEALGKRGVLMADLHTGNIGVTDKGVWKILDLGVSGTGTVANVTPLYGLGDVDVELIKSKRGPTYKAKITGVVGKIGVRGKTTDVYVGLDEITPSLVRDILRVSRSDGSGRPVPPGARRKIEKAVLEKLRSVEK